MSASSFSNSRRRCSVVDYAHQITAASVFGYASLGCRTGASRVELTSGKRRIQADYDEMSRRERCRTLFIDPDADPERCSFAPYERAAREPIDDPSEPRRRGLSAAHVMAITCDYPDGIVEIDARAAESQPADQVVDAQRPLTSLELAQRIKKRKQVEAAAARLADELEAPDEPTSARVEGVSSALATGFVPMHVERPSAALPPPPPPTKRRKGFVKRTATTTTASVTKQ